MKLIIKKGSGLKTRFLAPSKKWTPPGPRGRLEPIKMLLLCIVGLLTLLTLLPELTYVSPATLMLTCLSM
jgi:hypothetical protein